METNIVYKSDSLQLYFKNHRSKWEEFYDSERRVIEYLKPQASDTVLDMGCACGGLGNALWERYGIEKYVGVDINEQCIAEARSCYPKFSFHLGDFLDVKASVAGQFDIAFSLSCADWNVKTSELWSALFDKVKCGGSLIFSCRLTNVLTHKVFNGWQQVEGDRLNGKSSGEYAPYKVYSLESLLNIVNCLPCISKIYAYGYWGKTPATVSDIALTDVFYAVFCITKVGAHELTNAEPRLVLDVCPSLFISPAKIYGGQGSSV